MKRSIIQLDEDTHRRLRARAFREQRSIAAVVRELVAAGLDAESPRRPPLRLEAITSVRAGRSKPGHAEPVSEQHDDALASAFKR